MDGVIVSRRKPRFTWWVRKTPHGWQSPGGEIPESTVKTWMSQEKRRMSRLERQEGKRQAREE